MFPAESVPAPASITVSSGISPERYASPPLKMNVGDSAFTSSRSAVPLRNTAVDTPESVRESRRPSETRISPPAASSRFTCSAPRSTAAARSQPSFGVQKRLSVKTSTSPSRTSAGTGRLPPPSSRPLVFSTVSVPLPVMRTQLKPANVPNSSPPPSTRQSPSMSSRRTPPPTSGERLGTAQLSALMPNE